MEKSEFYYTKSKGTGGRIKRLYSDFVVEEIRKDRVCEAKAFLTEGVFEEELALPEKNAEYLHLDLEKINKDLHSAVRHIARSLHTSNKRVGYAGMKDKRAVTCQRISIWNPEPKLVERYRAKGIRLRNPEWSNEKIDLGDLLGNRFTVAIRDIALGREELEGILQPCFREIEKGIPNIFGEQRFGGIRAVSHLVGREIVKGNIENAVMLYLTALSEHEEKEVKEARAGLASTRDFKAALRAFPLKYRYERAILNALCRDKKDFAEAFRALPTRLRFLFTHAFQSYLFNELIRKRIEAGIGLEPEEGEPEEGGIPLGLLPGFESSYSPGKVGEFERDLMEKEDISFADFRLKELKECSSKGARRKILLKPGGMKLVGIEKDELFEGRLCCRLSFGLEKGAYATVVLGEITKNPNLNLLN